MSVISTWKKQEADLFAKIKEKFIEPHSTLIIKDVLMISLDKLMRILIKGRYECYIKKSADYNPYVKSDLYDWEFKLPINGFVFIDAYRGFNPYSGVEYV
jgi:hypothetical protein